jgi:hypothetical protein
MPLVEQQDIDAMKDIVFNAVGKLASRLDQANKVLEELYEDLSPLESLIQ